VNIEFKHLIRGYLILFLNYLQTKLSNKILE
jgi:hypothetical protein